MCLTFTFKHICGHEYSQHNIKCLHAIKAQLNLSHTHTIGCTGVKEKWKCLDEVDLPREYTKPGICESCRRTGLVASFLECSPEIEYEILRHWQAQKRILRAKQDHGDNNDGRYVTGTSEHQTQPSESSISSQGPETPNPTIVSDFEHVDCDIAPEIFSPILYDSGLQDGVGGGCREHEASMTVQKRP